MSESEEWHGHLVRFMDGASFTVEFDFGADTARIRGAVGWIAAEVAVADGTYEQVRAEAHRLIDLAVATDRCSKYGDRISGGEKKRNVTLAGKFGMMGPPRPLRSRWGSGG